MYSELVETSRFGPWAETVFISGLSLQVCKDYAVLRSCTNARCFESCRCTAILTAKSCDFGRIVAHGVSWEAAAFLHL